MDVQASPAALPEVRAWWHPFQVRLRRLEGGQALGRSVTGLLTALPTKHGDPLAQAPPAASAPRLQECLTNRPGDEDDLHRQRGQQMVAEATLGARGAGGG